MALPQLATRELTLDEAVDRGYAAMLEGEDVASVARAIVASGIDRDAAIVCAEKGLAAFIHARRSLEMDRALAEHVPESESRTGQRPRLPINHGRNFAKELWRVRLDTNYETADGTRKPLWGFSLADSTYLRDLARARAAGFNKVAEAMEAAVAALSKHGGTIDGLPVKVQQQIAKALA